MENPGRGKVLLVDDIKANVNILKANLKMDYDIEVAFDGRTALELALKSPPDLILLDVEMPDIDGYEVCRQLKADKNIEKVPVVFITSKNEEADETKGLSLGAIDYITKPFSIPIVKARVKNLMQMKKQQDILEKLSSIDGLTGIYNRRYFDQTFSYEWQRAIRAKTPLAIIMMDIDFFKMFNDHYGHASGDECLKSVAKTLSEPLNRPQDLVARYGGEEFIALLPDTEIAGALKIGESMRQNVCKLEIPHAQSFVSDYVTISVGLASMIPAKNHEPGFLLEGADKALYMAKKESRNICKTCSVEDMFNG